MTKSSYNCRGPKNISIPCISLTEKEQHLCLVIFRVLWRWPLTPLLSTPVCLGLLFYLHHSIDSCWASTVYQELGRHRLCRWRRSKLCLQWANTFWNFSSNHTAGKRKRRIKNSILSWAVGRKKFSCLGGFMSTLEKHTQIWYADIWRAGWGRCRGSAPKSAPTGSWQTQIPGPQYSASVTLQFCPAGLLMFSFCLFFSS